MSAKCAPSCAVDDGDTEHDSLRCRLGWVALRGGPAGRFFLSIERHGEDYRDASIVLTLHWPLRRSCVLEETAVSQTRQAVSQAV